MSIDRRGFLARGAAAAATLATLDPAVILAAPVPGHMDPAGRFGSLLNASEFANAPHILDPAILARFASQALMRAITSSGLASRHVLGGLPSVMMQGTNGSLGFPGSCEAQSFGYGLGTYTAARGIAGIDPQGGPADHISAAFLFEWAQKNQNATTCGGSMALPYLALLTKVGAPSAAQVPYKPNCHYIDGIDANIANYSGVGKFAIGSYRTLPNFLNGQSTYVGLLKQYLSAGHAIAFSGLVAKGYNNPGTAMVNGAFAPAGFIAKSGHGQMLVGYDDSFGHTGAFLVQNSFGTAWPYLSTTRPLLRGRLWWTYESFFASQGFGAIAYPIPPRTTTPTTVTLSASASGAPAARIIEATRTDQNGESYAVFETEFGHPVQLNTLSVTPPHGSAIHGGYNAPIKYGFTHVSRTASFPAGQYAVELNAHTLSSTGTPEQAVKYKGHVTVS